MEPILQVENLSKVFSQPGKPDLIAVEQVCFSLYPGEIVGIVGESGSGKSTVARLLARLTDATTGHIRVDGVDVTGLRGREVAPLYSKLQMVFQNPTGSFDPRRTLGDGICESLRNRGVGRAEREEKARRLLARCGLPEELTRRYPHQVSGGQCQRAAIARALMAEPKILIFDEATSGLDVTVQRQIMDLLRELHREKNLSYLFICHNLALVQQFCHRVLVMCDGKIVEQGTPDEVILHPRSEYTKRLVEAIF